MKAGNYDLIGAKTQMLDENGNILYSIKSIPAEYVKIKRVIKYNKCLAKKELLEELEG
ncbi:hypothetical protein [Coprobacillus sp. AF33-1AC]|uniref:hypothetical protein n=1 Tax=Coprobacillus sp. AF33-1AC TaxID=2292032 RepID=UPI001314C243|nr:hypothetical protein [Coprobacillus sp. AF33-1AC]